MGRYLERCIALRSGWFSVDKLPWRVHQCKEIYSDCLIFRLQITEATVPGGWKIYCLAEPVSKHLVSLQPINKPSGNLSKIGPIQIYQPTVAAVENVPFTFSVFVTILGKYYRKRYIPQFHFATFQHRILTRKCHIFWSVLPHNFFTFLMKYFVQNILIHIWEFCIKVYTFCHWN